MSTTMHKQKRKHIGLVVLSLFGISFATSALSSPMVRDSQSSNIGSNQSNVAYPDVNIEKCHQYLQESSKRDIPSFCTYYLNGYIHGLIQAANGLNNAESNSNFENRAYMTRIGVTRALGGDKKNKVCLPKAASVENIYVTVRDEYRKTEATNTSFDNVIFSTLKRKYPC